MEESYQHTMSSFEGLTFPVEATLLASWRGDPNSQSCVICRDALAHPPLHPLLVNNGAFIQVLCSDSEEWSPIPSKKITKIGRFQSCEVSPYTFLGPSPFLQFWGILLTNRPFGRTHSSPLNVSSLTVSLVGLALLGGGNYGCRFRACSWYSPHKNSDLLWNSNLQASWR